MSTIGLKVETHKHEGSDPKFSDRHTWANSVDPDQKGLIRVYTVSYEPHHEKTCLRGF